MPSSADCEGRHASVLCVFLGAIDPHVLLRPSPSPTPPNSLYRVHNAMALGRALKRKVIMPKMMCWYEHRRRARPP